MAIGENMIKNGYINQEQLDKALQEKARSPEEKLGEIIVRLGFATKDQVEKSL